jgi:excinuclease ABC subunit C
MISASEVQDYEKAAVFRDRMIAVEKTLEKQVAMTNDFKDRDVIALARSSEVSLIAILFIRSGYLLGMRHFSFSETLSTAEEMIGTFIRQYYEKNPFIPKELLLPVLMEDGALIEDWLCNIKGEKVSIIRPQRGEKALLVKMAMQNAEDRLKDLLASFASARDILVRLQKSFKMDRIPRRIECFDISNISGTEVVAGMVVFKDGRPQKSLYRKYKIQTVTGQDDYACMAEVLKRRYGKGEESKPLPDIVMIDGGRGHLNMAVSVINELALESKFEIIGIAKRDAKGVETEDKIYRPGRVNPVSFGKGGGDLLFLQRIRDEAHRFAIAFHRSCRTKTFMRSKLDAISGIGPKRKEALFKKFGSIQNIQAASMDELSALPGMNRKAAEAVKKGLATRDER